MVERLDPSRVCVSGGREEDIKSFIESDFRIRSGLCPNGHGLMNSIDGGQCCPHCGFECNKLSELTKQ
jgi:hypothetical protein